MSPATTGQWPLSFAQVIATKDQFDLVYVCDHAIMLLRGECTSHSFFTKPRGNLMFVSLTIGCFVAWSTMEQLTCPIVLISIIPHTDRSAPTLWPILFHYCVSLFDGFAVFCCEQFFEAGVQESLCSKCGSILSKINTCGVCSRWNEWRRTSEKH
jgi:hypothetical protein